VEKLSKKKHLLSRKSGLKSAERLKNKKARVGEARAGDYTDSKDVRDGQKRNRGAASKKEDHKGGK